MYSEKNAKIEKHEWGKLDHTVKREEMEFGKNIYELQIENRYKTSN